MPPQLGRGGIYFGSVGAQDICHVVQSRLMACRWSAIVARVTWSCNNSVALALVIEHRVLSLFLGSQVGLTVLIQQQVGCPWSLYRHLGLSCGPALQSSSKEVSAFAGPSRKSAGSLAGKLHFSRTAACFEWLTGWRRSLSVAQQQDVCQTYSSFQLSGVP